MAGLCVSPVHVLRAESDVALSSAVRVTLPLAVKWTDLDRGLMEDAGASVYVARSGRVQGRAFGVGGGGVGLRTLRGVWDCGLC